MRFKLSVGLATISAVAFVVPVSSHHSHGNYVVEKFIDLQGVVKEVHFVVPHAWVYIEVKDANGQPHVWAVEATSRTGLEKIGVARDYVKPGDPIKVRCHPLRDGAKGCLFGFLKAKDGTVKDWDGSNAPTPKDF